MEYFYPTLTFNLCLTVWNSTQVENFPLEFGKHCTFVIYISALAIDVQNHFIPASLFSSSAEKLVAFLLLSHSNFISTSLYSPLYFVRSFVDSFNLESLPSALENSFELFCWWVLPLCFLLLLFFFQEFFLSRLWASCSDSPFFIYFSLIRIFWYFPAFISFWFMGEFLKFIFQSVKFFISFLMFHLWQVFKFLFIKLYHSILVGP